MYATIRRYSDNPGLADNLATRGEEVKALLQGVEGFRAYYRQGRRIGDCL